MEDLTRWPSVPKAAQEAGVSRQILNRHVRNGKIDSRMTALGVLVNPASLEKYIAARRQREEHGGKRRWQPA